MTDSRPLQDVVAELRGLLRKATPEPWNVTSWTCHANTAIAYGNGQILAECSGFGRSAVESEPDASLIVAMRNALPQLLEAAVLTEKRELQWREADRLRAELRHELTSAIERAQSERHTAELAEKERDQLRADLAAMTQKLDEEQRFLASYGKEEIIIGLEHQLKAALAARVVTLPQRWETFPGGEVTNDAEGEYLLYDDVLAMLKQAGITVQAEQREGG